MIRQGRGRGQLQLCVYGQISRKDGNTDEYKFRQNYCLATTNWTANAQTEKEIQKQIKQLKIPFIISKIIFNTGIRDYNRISTNPSFKKHGKVCPTSRPR